MVRLKLLPLAAGVLLSLAILPARAQDVLVKAEKLSLRKKADASADRVRSLVRFDGLSVKSRKGDWSEVQTTEGEKGWVLSSYLAANTFVTVKVDKVNIRRGPGDSYAVVMKVTRNYPLKVLKHTPGWLRVEDFDGDGGWVMETLVAFDPYVITRQESCNVRTESSEGSKIVFTAERGVILKVLEEKKGWLRIKHSDGDEGWVSAKVVFGWLNKTG